MSVLSLMDIMAGAPIGASCDQVETQPALPSGEDYKEATLMFLRRLELANNTTASNIESKFSNIANGMIPPMKKPTIVFPTYKSPGSLRQSLGQNEPTNSARPKYSSKGGSQFD